MPHTFFFSSKHDVLDKTSDQTENNEVQDTVKEIMKQDKKRIDDKLTSLSDREYAGRWRVNDASDRELVSKHLNNIHGVVKTRLQYYKEGGKYPIIKIVNIMYDGGYRDQVVYQKISLSDFIYTEDGPIVILKQQKASVEIAYGRLYSISLDHTCFVDVHATFKEIAKDKLKTRIQITSDGS